MTGLGGVYREVVGDDVAILPLIETAAGLWKIGSDVSVALIAYLVKRAEGGEIAAPGLNADTA